jgi:DNA-binding NarL/FixJ family response regulator
MSTDLHSQRGSGQDAWSGRVAPIRVVVAEDSYVVREFLTAALTAAHDVTLVSVCRDARELADSVATRRPDVIVTDIRMPPSGGDEGLRIAGDLRVTHPRLGVVVLSQYAEPAYAIALLAGGSGRRAYLLKDRLRSRNDLVGAIRTVANGGSVIDPKIVEVLIDARLRVDHSLLGQLTVREREVLAEMASGKSNAAIARSLVLTKGAVEKHVNAIFAKLSLSAADDVSRRVVAVLMYLSEAP